jgi:hypothetical protein
MVIQWPVSLLEMAFAFLDFWARVKVEQNIPPPHTNIERTIVKTTLQFSNNECFYQTVFSGTNKTVPL